MTTSPATGAASAHFERNDFFGLIRRRVLLSIAATVGWLSLALLYLAFWAPRFSLFQNIVVVAVSLLVVAGVVVGAWISFGIRFIDHGDD